MQQFDVLQSFLYWWMANKIQNPPNEKFINYDGPVIETVLFRQAPFQVQQCIVAPNSEIPDHIHPEVDSFEVYMGGDICFRVDGEDFAPPEPGTSHIRVLPSSFHGATVGQRGGMFLSVQHWLNQDNPPSFISMDWEFANQKETKRSTCQK